MTYELTKILRLGPEDSLVRSVGAGGGRERGAHLRRKSRHSITEGKEKYRVQRREY